ncbi:hypothetical protein C2E23DRAFT_503643 [Lenzites betulinus]|nr:hypothetical protein C2E23DRAFT_503643 [Lenzites betulinus]
MSSQQHAAAVILESIRVFRVDLTGARNITRDATLANVRNQGLAVQYTLQGTFTNVAGWTNAFAGLELAPFDDSIAMRVATDFTGAITVFTDLMIALIEKHAVLTSPESPLAPDGAIIGREISTLNIGLQVCPLLKLASFLHTSHIAHRARILTNSHPHRLCCRGTARSRRRAWTRSTRRR